jgi:hypothetical protein
MRHSPDWTSLYRELSDRIAQDDFARSSVGLRLDRIALLRQLRNRRDAEAAGTYPVLPMPERELMTRLAAVL